MPALLAVLPLLRIGLTPAEEHPAAAKTTGGDQ
jgi:hypothetical protein